MNELKTGSEIIFGNHQHLSWRLYSAALHTMTWLVTTQPPPMRSKWREYYKNGSLLQSKQTKQKPENQAAASLSVIWLRSSHAVVREMPWISPKHVRGGKEAGSRVMLSPFLPALAHQAAVETKLSLLRYPEMDKTLRVAFTASHHSNVSR